MSDENITAEEPALAVNEGLTQGGDITLRSTDGIDFSVHSLLLSLASPVFSELLRTDRDEVIEFSEDVEILALVLNFIYPKPTPTITSISLLNDAFRAANKYRLDSMKTGLREQIAPVDSPVSAHADPLAAFFLAPAYGFVA
ncbi:hypothetical protein B0J17DRAFT_633043 [Rhizoctonia solani]|nr:hypothetical protein B0J17DRAFT_633043 [Rhizoctonia solani]